jgi:hypothetical protein
MLKGKFERKYTDNEKSECWEILKAKISNPYAMNTVDTIMSGIGNYQAENDIDAKDILIEIVKHKSFNDVINLLEEQLEDTTKLGLCPSGRVTRLYQVWKAINEID